VRSPRLAWIPDLAWKFEVLRWSNLWPKVVREQILMLVPAMNALEVAFGLARDPVLRMKCSKIDNDGWAKHFPAAI
jgi:hypothetical protein